MEVFSWILENKESILAVIGAFYTFATAVALITPSDKDDTILEKIGSIADKVGLNIKGK